MEIMEGDYIVGFWNVGGSDKGDWLATVIRRGENWLIESRLHDYGTDKREVSKIQIPVAEMTEEEVLKRMAKSAWQVTEEFPEDIGTQIEFGRVQSADFDVFLKKLQEAKHLKVKVAKVEVGAGPLTAVVTDSRKPSDLLKQPWDTEPSPAPDDERGQLIAKIKSIFGFMFATEDPVRRAGFMERLKTEKVEILKAILEGAENIIAASNLLGREASQKAMQEASAKLKELGWTGRLD